MDGKKIPFVYKVLGLLAFCVVILAYTVPWALSYYTSLESRDLFAVYMIIVLDAICIFFFVALRVFEKQLSAIGKRTENLRNLRYLWIALAITSSILTVLLYKENILVLMLVMLAFFGMIWLTFSVINPIYYLLNPHLKNK